MAESAVASVVRAFGTLAAKEAAFLRGVNADADLLRAELRRMQCFLRDADAKRRAGGRDSERLKNWVVDVRDAAYDAGNALEEADFLARHRHMRRGFLGALPWLANLAALHTFGVKIRRVRARIRQISDSAVAYGITDLGEASALADVEEQEVTPYDLSWNSADSDFFVGFHEERDAIFKELLDPEISPICVVSIVGMAGSGKSTLARKVYNDPRSSDGGAISGGKWKQMTSEKLESMGEEDVKELLSDFLAQRKFLVVLDDVWKSSSYDKISKILSVLPDVNNGSRIVLTTRDMDVARHVNRRSSIHEKKLLDEKESWELLEKWSFPEYRDVSSADRSRLMEIGKKLAVKCKGLPLALVVLGGYLSRNLDYDIWSGLVGNLDWEARRNDEPFWKIIDRSYNDLPNHQLKSCFLYLASFPEDYVIRVARLCKLLIAEGLIPHRQNRTMEDTAREYIKELVQRCMLQAVERSKWHGSIKSVVLHDVIREWAIAEARREGLFNIWSNPTDCDQALSDSVTAYRVALHNFAGRTEINVAMPKLRTLLVFFNLPAVSVLCRLKFLRVLDLHGLTVKERRLAENGNKHIARRNVKKWAALFRALEGMEQLVFLHLESWRTQRRTKWRGRVFSTQLFGSISRHRHLQVLELAGDWLCGVGQLSKLPHCLKKLKLIASEELSKDPMPVLGIHPNLVVLVLESAFKGNGMICHAEGFPRLRHLTFEHVGRLGSWNVEAGAFPSLTHLNLSVSSFPVVPPLGLFHVTSLQTLLLKQHPMDESSICLSTVGKLEERGCEVIIKRLG
ncbi:hypothetical protein VPH35_023426 [Triticum aestivum]|uniref:AAA+ ATPase domain-containing protein n=1 Tax=Triticum aestivum TaxID=4565 RepID=A0A3B6B4D0_WHEAT